MLSIQNLFRRIVILGGTFAFILLTVASSYQYHDTLVNNVEESAILQGQSEAGRLGIGFDQAIQMAVQLSTQTEVGQDMQSGELQQVAAELLKDSKLVFGIGVWLEPYEMGSDKYYNSLYMYRNSDGQVISDPYYNSPDYDYFSWKWWIDAQKLDNTAVWSDPYYDVRSDQYFITASYPIIEEGRQVGVATVDISMFSIMDYFSNLQPGNQGFTSVISHSGDFLADPRTIKGFSSASNQLLFSEHQRIQKQGSSGASLLTLDDRDYWVVMAPVANTGFTLISARPMEEINSIAIPIIARNAFLYLAILIAVIYVLNKFTKHSILDPLKDTTRIVREIASGDLSGAIPMTSALPLEIQSLLNSVGHMRDEIRVLLDEQKERNRSIHQQKEEIQQLYDDLHESYEESQVISSELTATHLSLLEVNSRLTESEKRLKMAVLGAGAGLWDWIIKDEIVVIDDRYRDIIGYPPGSQYLQHFYIAYDLNKMNENWDLVANGIHPDDLDSIKTLLNRILKGEIPHFICEYRRLHRDGHWIWVQDSGCVMERDSQGRALRIVGMIQDITERKTAEEALIKSTSLYKGIVNATENGVVVFDAANYRIIEANRSAELISGYSRFELLNRKCSDFLVGDEESRLGRVQDRIDELIRESVCVIEIRAISKSGEVVPLMINLTLISLENQLLVLAVICDLSESIKRKEEKEKYQRYEKEFDKISAISLMSAGIVHEISQPVASIKLVADGLIFLNDNGQSVSVEDALQGFGSISGQCERIEKIVTNLRSLVNSFEERESNSSDINLAIENVLRSLEKRISEQGVTVNWSPDPSCKQVIGNRIEHELIVTNLMNNALDALNFSGQVSPVIAIETIMIPDAAIIKISDNGPGMADDVAAHIWEPFFSTNKGRNSKGMGMGLALVRTIVTRLRGHVYSENNAEGGALFEVELPLGKGEKEVPYEYLVN